MKINQIIEANKVGQYYTDNPDKAMSTGINPPASKKDDGYDRSNNSLASEIAQFERKLYEKWAPVFGDQVDKIFQPSGRGLDYSVDSLLRSNSPFERFVDRAELELDSKGEAKLRSLYPQFVKDVRTLQKKRSINQKIPAYTAKKNAAGRGLSTKDYDSAMAWAERYTAASARTIPKEIWPALQKLTVNPKELPDVVYRGLFFDGAKIKDLEKWQKKWYPGSTPGLKPTKASSWSTSIGLATQFMTSQDMVKDQENGFAILLKYEINSPDVVVADFRNLPGNTFWNQQEILLSPEAKSYEVVAVIPYQEYSAADNKLNAFQKKYSAPNASPAGSSKSELLVNQFFKINQMQISPNIKEQWRSFSKATVAQVKRVIPVNNYIAEYEDKLLPVKFPLYCLLAGNSKYGAKYWSMEINDAVNINTVSVTITSAVGGYGMSNQSNIVKKLVGKADDNPGEKVILTANLSLVNDEYNNLVFNLAIGNEFKVQEVEHYGRKDKLSDAATQIQSALNNPTVIQQLKQEIADDIVNIYGNTKNKNVTLNITSA
jgi:hypothetical protein